MQDCNLHTVLRLPRGNVHALQPRCEGERHFLPERIAHRKRVDFRCPFQRAGHHEKRSSINLQQHFEEFEKCYGDDPNGQGKRVDLGDTGRFRKFHLSQVKERDYKLDITWLKDESLEDSDELSEPQDLASEAITEFEAIVDDLKEIVALVEKEEAVEV